ncbi:MAG: hypothetical protein GQ574_21915 [Crocinitomix sp.]|nr:hypothetical protein [Crocinitomix sp.]
MTLSISKIIQLKPSFKQAFLVAITLLFITACRKDDIDVIPEPEDEEEVVEEEDPGCEGVFEEVITYFDGGAFESGPYLAAYPGSWWTYSNEDSLYCELGHTHIKNLTSRNFETCEEYYNYTEVTVPQIIGNYTRNSGEGYIYADSILVDIEGETVIAQQISTEVGSQWYEFIDNTHAYENPWYTFYPEREVIEHYDSLELPNGNWFYDVLEISQVLRYDGKDGEWLTGYYHLFYANEIGLIWEKNIFVPSYDRHLEDYYIAPH